MVKKNWRKRSFLIKRKNMAKLFILLVLGMTVGFAAINTTLKLVGTLNVAKTTWIIEWENPSATGGVTPTSAPTVNSEDPTKVEYQVTLSDPGDYFEFTVDARNKGTIDAMITNVENVAYENNTQIAWPTFIENEVTYSDGTALANDHYLKAGTKESFKVKLTYKTGLKADNLPPTSKTYKFVFTLTYMQADEEAKPVRVNFETASWNDIVSAYNSNASWLQSDFEAGNTRDVDLGSLGVHPVRIANLTPCSEVSTTSKTACGLVIEFTDIITQHIINPYSQGGSVTGDGSKGGWEYSVMRTYFNDETANADSIYNKLPSELKSKIISTNVISGYSVADSTHGNFQTEDKIYLLSLHEVCEDVDGNSSSGVNTYDKSYDTTRQLDYYKNKGVTTNSYSEIIKKRGASASSWWLRSAYYPDTSSFLYVDYNGEIGATYEVALGVSPAFRLAN